MRPKDYNYKKRRRIKRGSKTLCEKKHAHRRFKQRFGIQLTDELHRKFIGIIQDNKAQFVEKQSHRITVWDIEFEGQLIRVVYDKQRKTIVTCLSKELADIAQKMREKYAGSNFKTGSTGKENT